MKINKLYLFSLIVVEFFLFINREKKSPAFLNKRELICPNNMFDYHITCVIG